MSKQKYQALIRDEKTGEIGAFILEGPYDHPYVDGSELPAPQGDVDINHLINSHSERTQAMDRHYGRRQR